MKKQRKSYSSQEKVKVLRRHFVDQVPVLDLLSYSSITLWAFSFLFVTNIR